MLGRHITTIRATLTHAFTTHHRYTKCPGTSHVHAVATSITGCRHLLPTRILRRPIITTTASMAATGSEESKSAGSGLVFRQLFDRESCTYTYLLGDAATKEAVLIDPVVELVDRDVQIATELGLTVKYGLNTHVHADHITGTGQMKKVVAGMKSVLSKASGGKADVLLGEGETVKFGSHKLTGLGTPGHTEGCMSYVLDDNEAVFTGDTLLIRGCGRTDFQGGSSEKLYNSVHSKLFTLPDECRVYPAHDYKGRTMSTIGEEKAHNPRLTKDLAGFVEIMDNLGLAYPKKLDVAVPANMVCGLFDVPDAADATASA